MEKDEKPASAEELLRRIQELQKRHAHIKQEISKLKVSGEPLTMKLTETQYLNILHSMGQAIFIYDLNHRIIFWNRGAEDMYGYTSSEVIGRSPTELLAEPKDALLSEIILERTVKGESWCGEFPIKNKSGNSFVVICANTPYRDENRILLGAMCLSSDSRPYQVTKVGVSVNVPTRTSFDSRQPLQTSIASKISNLASKVKLKMRVKENYTDHKGRSDISSSPIGVFFYTETEEHFMRKLTLDSYDESKNKNGIRKILSSKAEDWMGKKGISWPWKENETENESVDSKLGHVGWHRFNVNQAYQHGTQMSSAKLDSQLCDTLRVSSNRSTCRSNSDDMSIKSNVVIKDEGETDIMDYEILWEDLITKEQIGQGSCGTVYHGLWYGSDVALKLFLYQEFSDGVIVSFIQEVSLMKRLRHPNILLFMGAVTSPQHLCIVTEFLPRGSLFRILQRNTTRLDWRRRIHMAMDIARGMNYLHCYNPPIVHRDLKSSNLLVDKNWTVKVGDFGLSRIKHQTYLNINSGKGTPQWMAPEIIRNEQADEKSDVYSYGVVLWEITTEKIPWDDLNPMQVIAAVGFMNRKLEIPKDVDPLWASLIESCCSSEPQSRPTFQEILYTLKDLQKKLAIERRR